MDCFESADFYPQVSHKIADKEQLFWLGTNEYSDVINPQLLQGAVITIISIHPSFTPALLSLVEMNPFLTQHGSSRRV